MGFIEVAALPIFNLLQLKRLSTVVVEIDLTNSLDSSLQESTTNSNISSHRIPR